MLNPVNPDLPKTAPARILESRPPSLSFRAIGGEWLSLIYLESGQPHLLVGKGGQVKHVQNKFLPQWLKCTPQHQITSAYLSNFYCIVTSWGRNDCLVRMDPRLRGGMERGNDVQEQGVARVPAESALLQATGESLPCSSCVDQIIWRFKGAIKSSYDGRDMTFANDCTEEIKRSLDTFPISLTEEQFSSIARRNDVFNVLAGIARSPAYLAGIDAAEFPIAAEVEKQFKEAVEHYRTEFIKSCKLDQESYEKMTSSERQKNPEQFSVNRYAWMQKVGIEEDLRINTCSAMLERRAEALVDELNQEETEGFVNDDKLTELTAINKIYRYLTLLPLQINHANETIDVQIFINQLSSSAVHTEA